MLPCAGVILAFGEEFSRQAFRSMVLKTGFDTIRVSSSCQDVLTCLNQSARKWSLLILDGRMARAIETVRTLRNRVGPHIKILMVFAGPTQHEIMEATQAGADNVLTFPVSQATLEKKLARLVELPKARVSPIKRAEASSLQTVPTQRRAAP
ncbi:MAG: hypothetical protein AABZ64_07015 [Nitrospinota bacterium]|mgnify:CR=1 FL=1